MGMGDSPGGGPSVSVPTLRLGPAAAASASALSSDFFRDSDATVADSDAQKEKEKEEKKRRLKRNSADPLNGVRQGLQIRGDTSGTGPDGVKSLRNNAGSGSEDP
jgi:hypothetical protein